MPTIVSQNKQMINIKLANPNIKYNGISKKVKFI